MVWRLNCFLFFSRWVVGLNFCAGRLLQCPRDEAFPSSYYRLDGWINLRCCLVSYIFILVIFFDHQYGSYQLFFRKKGRRNEAVVILSRRFEMRLPEGHWWLVYARIEGTREREHEGGIGFYRISRRDVLLLSLTQTHQSSAEASPWLVGPKVWAHVRSATHRHWEQCGTPPLLIRIKAESSWWVRCKSFTHLHLLFATATTPSLFIIIPWRILVDNFSLHFRIWLDIYLY